jgi:arylsulfatase A-like enzyme
MTATDSRRPKFLAAAMLAAATAILVACSGGRDTTARSVVLVTIDTLRADRLRCYGNDEVDTPNIDRLAEEGYRFANVVASAPLTLPSHATILTGQYPHVHGARANGAFRLSPSTTTVAEILRDRGFRTAAFVSTLVLERRFGLDQGFEHYDDEYTDPILTGEDRSAEKIRLLEERGVDPAYFVLPMKRYGPFQRRAEKTTDAALSWIRDHAGERFFVWLHLFDPHGPYSAPAPWDSKYEGRLDGREAPLDPRKVPHYQLLPGVTTREGYVAAYDGEIAYTDHHVGRVVDELRRLGLDDETLVVFTADHGESLGEHDYWFEHGDNLFDNEIRVPLIVRPPGGRTEPAPAFEEQVATLDLFPTILEWLGIDGEGIPGEEEGVSGRSLLPLVEGRPGYEERPLYSEAYIPMLVKTGTIMRCVRTRDAKLVVLGDLDAPRPRVWTYDLESDPREVAPIRFHEMSPARQGEALRMMEELRRLARLEPAVEAPGSRMDLDADTEAKLRALGYIDR